MSIGKPPTSYVQSDFSKLIHEIAESRGITPGELLRRALKQYRELESLASGRSNESGHGGVEPECELGLRRRV